MEVTCPNAANHTPQPGGYLEWHDWAQRASQTHKQIRCSGCGLFAIWVAKRPTGKPLPPIDFSTCLHMPRKRRVA